VSAIYVDTSALGRILLGEPDAPLIRDALAQFDDWVSSHLLRVELRRLTLRAGQAAESAPLTGVFLVALDEATLAAAETIEPSNVATLDAIHLATAVRLKSRGRLDAMLTYDLRLAEGARHHDIEVVSPA
jgi:predicted nucleic acid-binding protein